MAAEDDDPVAPAAPPVVPDGPAAPVPIRLPAPGRLWARVYREIDGRRELLGVGEGVTITPGVPTPLAGDTTSGAPGLPLVGPLRAAIDAALAAGPLGRGAGLMTWSCTAILFRLRQGLAEEEPSIERLVGHYGVDPRGLADQLAAAALRCHREGRPAPLDRTRQQALRGAADALAAHRDALAATWTARIEREVRGGWSRPQAAELLDVDGLHWVVGLERFQTVLFAAVTEPRQRAILVLLRAAATVGAAAAHSLDDLRERSELVERYVRAAVILEESLPNVPGGSGPASLSFLDEIRDTERVLRAVREQARGGGRRVLAVERAVASDLLRFLVRETRRTLTDHAGALLALSCPALGGWRDTALIAARRALVPSTQRALGPCRPHALPPVARAAYVANLGARLRTLLGARLLRSLRPVD